jgi:hypothetical protein
MRSLYSFLQNNFLEILMVWFSGGEGVRFESETGQLLSWQSFLVVFSSPYKLMML